MYDVDVMVYGPEGEDLVIKRVCNKEEVNEILKYYGNTEKNKRTKRCQTIRIKRNMLLPLLHENGIH